MTRVCIVGLGAVGGLLGARLAAAGCRVAALARGATRQAVASNGLRLQEGQRSLVAHVEVSDDARALGPQELIIIALKGYSLPSALPSIAHLLDAHTHVLSVMNGVPWWFPHGLGPEADTLPMARVDPGGQIVRTITPSRVIGAVANLSASTPQPGVVEAQPGARLTIGEPMGGADSARCRETMALLSEAGFTVEGSPRIHQTLWFKLWGNMTVNPITALTGATADLAVNDDLVREFMTRCMQEAASIGDRLGLHIDQDPESRHAVTARLGAFQTSMLQDVHAGRTLELDAVIGIVADFARHLRVAAPHIDALFGLARLFGETHELYPSRITRSHLQQASGDNQHEPRP